MAARADGLASLYPDRKHLDVAREHYPGHLRVVQQERRIPSRSDQATLAVAQAEEEQLRVRAAGRAAVPSAPLCPGGGAGDRSRALPRLSAGGDSWWSMV